MPVAEILAGIALVKSSVDFIKSNIDTVNDIGDIAGAIDGLFQGQQEVQKKSNNKSSPGISDQFGIKSVAQEMIDAKLAAEKIAEMRQLIDFRFGHGTWQSIVDERARRIQEAKEAAMLARKEQAKRAKEFWSVVKTTATVFGGIIFIVTVIVAAIMFSGT